jgi:armadillo repeat-containing protein 6
MAKVISQETYDEVIKENIIEFSMSVEESRVETRKQFLAQKVNLHNLILDLTINVESGQPVIKETIAKLKGHAEKKKILNAGELEKQLDTLMLELLKSVPHRVLAAKTNTQEYLLKLIEAEIEMDKQDEHGENSVSCELTTTRKASLIVFFFRFQVLHKLILSSHAMTHKNPDIFDAKALKIVMRSVCRLISLNSH